MPNTEAYRGKGEVYLRMNNPEEAVVCYTKAIELSPDSHETYFARGNAYNKQAMYSMAASDFERAMKLNPVNETYKRNRDFALELMKSEK